MTKTRNLIVACDGTWNEPETRPDGSVVGTNVVRFMDALATVGDRQVKHYEQGVGTRKWEAIPGALYGYGLERRIAGCYRFLRNRFADAGWEHEQNRVFLMGFSRGAYTVRRIAGLLDTVGLPRDMADIEAGIEAYENRDLDRIADWRDSGRFFAVPIEMVGIWDTVKATNDPDYADRRLPSNVKAGYHAMAIDERRLLFPVLEWDDDPRVTQAWFAGTHSDVGGGYVDDGLADVALEWMIYRGLSHGLQFDARRVKTTVTPRPTGPIHESLTGIWETLGEFLRPIAPTSPVHASVRVRREELPDYRPNNLPDAPTYLG